MVRSSPRSSCVIALTLVLVAGRSTSAHRMDEYLQATRLSIDAERLQIALDLTPGIAVAERVVSDVDNDANKMISAGEAQIYYGRVLSAIAVELDGRPLVLELSEGTLPDVDAMRRGEGTIRIHATAPLAQLGEGTHHLRYRNSHHSDIGVYLANVLVPSSDRVSITRQQRDVEQRELTVEYVLAAEGNARVHGGALVAMVGALMWVTTRWRRRPRASQS